MEGEPRGSVESPTKESLTSQVKAIETRTKPLPFVVPLPDAPLLPFNLLVNSSVCLDSDIQGKTLSKNVTQPAVAPDEGKIRVPASDHIYYLSKCTFCNGL